MPNYDDLFSAQPDPQGGESFDKDAWAVKKQHERDQVYGLIDAYVHDMGSLGKLTFANAFQTYLDVQARFDRYSVSNAVLIAAQMPEATRLADFDAWKDNGVYVKRGAEAITILEPGKEYTRQEDGSTGVFYNPKKVFDISQTSAIQQTAPAVNRDERLLLKALMNNAPCRFQIANDMPEGVNVFYHSRDNVIFVRQGLDAATLFRGMAQELAIAHMSRSGHECQTPDFAAYSVSYMLCKRNGVSVEVFSFDPMPEEYGLMDAKAIRAELGVMRDVAGTITADMNRLFAAQEKPQKNRGDAR